MSLPSLKRPVRLLRRQDLTCVEIDAQGGASLVVKEPVGLAYHRLGAAEWHLLALLDGHRSVEEIRDSLQRKFPAVEFQIADIQRQLVEVHRRGLTVGTRPGQATQLLDSARKQDRSRILERWRNPLAIRAFGWQPETGLALADPFLGWLFRPMGLVFGCMLIASTLFWLLVHFHEFERRLPAFNAFFSGANLLSLWATIAFAKLIHELGHGVSCRRLGAECHEIGMMLLVFSPSLYCDTTDSWMLRERWKRMLIASAGMYLESILSAVAFILWWNTTPGTFHFLCLNLMVTSSVSTVLFNANPLMRLDGYFILSDLCGIPNLRARSDAALRDFAAWVVFGSRPQPDPFDPGDRPPWLIPYAIASLIYRWTVTFGIVLFLANALKPFQLQSLGLMAVVAVLGVSTISIARSGVRLMKAQRFDERRPGRFQWVVIALIVFLAAAALIPLRLPIDVDLYVKPRQIESVFSTVPGRVVQILVKPGEVVRKGQLLVRLSNPDIEDRIPVLRTKIQSTQVECETLHALDLISQEQIATARLKSLQEQLEEALDHQTRLTILAPDDGIVLAPATTSPSRDSKTMAQLPQWSGTPLDEKNLGSLLEAKTHLMSLSRGETVDAVLLIDQRHRNDFSAGHSVAVKLEHLPDVTFHATVSEISKRDSEFAPGGISQRSGGDVPTLTDSSGRERLMSTAYQATVPLDAARLPLTNELHGRARALTSRTVGQWVWEWARRTFYFRL